MDKGMQLPSTMLQSYGSSSWVLPVNDIESKILSTLVNNSVRLGDIADVINGIQTSAEDVFPITNWKEQAGQVIFERGGSHGAVEKNLTRPYLMDSTAKVWSYLPIEADALIIFPYEYGAKGEAVLIPPVRLKTHYPLTWNYLNSFGSR
ncbi:MAG: adenine methyltransferase [Paenibacillus sp.]|jgi:hypothetical protein|nr:adenine methyltransferase [Paenibacillus sp.]